MAYEAKGYYLEDFEIGKCYESVGRTITEADVVNFAGVSGDFNPLHMDDEFAKNNIQPDGNFRGNNHRISGDDCKISCTAVHR